MARTPKAPPDPEVPSDFPQVAPRELYATSDIRFVMMEMGKLTANVERLIADVRGHGDKIDGLRHQASFIKGGIAVGIVLIGAFIAIASFVLSSKWDAMLVALRAVAKTP
jgi:hypothetical protein